ncbi:hypothetical protein A5875_000352, partial [Enterococcus sp. 3H8_DIV0648]
VSSCRVYMSFEIFIGMKRLLI